MLVSEWEKPDSDSIARTVPTPLVVDGGRDGDAPNDIHVCGVVYYACTMPMWGCW